MNVTIYLEQNNATLLNGDFAWNNVTATMQNVIGGNPQGNTNLKAIKCVTTCPTLGLPPGEREAFTRNWTDTDNWPMGLLPVDGDDV